MKKAKKIISFVLVLAVLAAGAWVVVSKKRSAKTTIVFAHNHAGISYAATLRHLLPETRLVAIVFGREAEELAETIAFPCEKIVEKAVHNPVPLLRKIREVFGWDA